MFRLFEKKVERYYIKMRYAPFVCKIMKTKY